MKKVWKVFSLLLAVVMVTAVFAACGTNPGTTSTSSSTSSTSSSSTPSNSSSSAPVSDIGKGKIGVFVPLTGDQKQYGDAISSGIKMRVEEYNKANSTNYVVEVFDDKGDPKEAVNIANKIVADKEMICAMGSYASSCVLSAGPVFEQNKLLFLSPGASHPDVPKIGEYIFTYGMQITIETKQLMNSVAKLIDKGSIAMIYQNTDHGVSTFDTIKEYYPSLGGKFLGGETFVAGSTKDFRPILSKLKQLNPDAIVVNSTYPDGAQMILQARELGMEMPFIGWSMFAQDEFIKILGEKVGEVYICTNMPIFLPSTLANPEAFAKLSKAEVDFVNNYKTFCGLDANGFSVLGYDSVGILLSAIEMAKSTDSTALRDILPDAFLAAKGLLCGDVVSFENKVLARGTLLYKVTDGTFLPVT